jgi:hypothetical protein
MHTPLTQSFEVIFKRIRSSDTLLSKSTISTAMAAFILATVSIGFAKEPLTEGETDPVMKDFDPYMIKALYGTDAKGLTGRFGAEGGMADLLTEPAFVELIKKHDVKLFNGPMLGDLKPTSAKFWVRTAGPAKVQIKVGEQASAAAETSATDDFTAVMIEAVHELHLCRYSRWQSHSERRLSLPHGTGGRPEGAVRCRVWFGSSLRPVERICLEQHGEVPAAGLSWVG